MTRQGLQGASLERVACAFVRVSDKLWREIMIEKLVLILAIWAGTTVSAFAVFSAYEVPEPGTGALLAAGALVVGGLRYITKR